MSFLSEDRRNRHGDRQNGSGTSGQRGDSTGSKTAAEPHRLPSGDAAGGGGHAQERGSKLFGERLGLRGQGAGLNIGASSLDYAGLYSDGRDGKHGHGPGNGKRGKGGKSAGAKPTGAKPADAKLDGGKDGKAGGPSAWGAQSKSGLGTTAGFDTNEVGGVGLDLHGFTGGKSHPGGSGDPGTPSGNHAETQDDGGDEGSLGVGQGADDADAGWGGGSRGGGGGVGKKAAWWPRAHARGARGSGGGRCRRRGAHRPPRSTGAKPASNCSPHKPLTHTTPPPTPPPPSHSASSVRSSSGVRSSFGAPHQQPATPVDALGTPAISSRACEHQSPPTPP